jgi:hypothetical protein
MIDPGSYWVLGVTVSIVASVLSCLGLIFQKYAHTQNQNLPEDKKAPVILGCVCSPCWWASFMLMGVLPFPLDFLAYSFAAQSLVAPFAALTLILNQLFAPLILKEKLHRLDIYASAIVFVGTLMTTLAGNHADVVYELEDLLELFKRATFIIGAVVLVLIMGFMIVSLRVTEAAQEAAGHGPAVGGTGAEAEVEAGQAAAGDELSKSSSTGEADAGAAPRAEQGQQQDMQQTDPPHKKERHQQQEDQQQQNNILLTTSFESTARAKAEQLELDETQAKNVAAEPQADTARSFLARLNRRLCPFYYGFVAGGFGALQTVFFKAVGVLFKSSVVDKAGSPWGSPYPYIFGIITIVLAIAQLSYLNMGMARYDAVLVFPIYNAMFVLLSVLFGSLYYDEFSNFVTWQLVVFPVGITITLAGISLFCFRPGADHTTKKPDIAASPLPPLARAPEDVLEDECAVEGNSANRSHGAIAIV